MFPEGPNHLGTPRKEGDSSESWSSFSTKDYRILREGLRTGENDVSERKGSGLETGTGGTTGSEDTTIEIMGGTLHQDGTMTMTGTGLIPADLMAGMIATETTAAIGLAIETTIALEAPLHLQPQHALLPHRLLLQLLQAIPRLPHLHHLNLQRPM